MAQKQKITIKPAGKKDIEATRGLIYYLMNIEKTGDPEKQTNIIIKERVLPTFKKSLLNKVFLAQKNNKTIGLVIVEKKFGASMAVAYIVVDKDSQGMGVGSYLINYAQDYVRKNKGRSLQVMVGIENKKAQKFYKKQGFDNWCYVFKKDI